MAIEFAKAYKNFEKFHNERMASSKSNASAATASTGLLAPRGGSSAPKKMQSQTQQSELEKVSAYVEQIRSRRMKMKNGK